MNRPPKIGDYVLATKYDDGDPHDQFAVGFYAAMTWHGRYTVVDGNGKPFRHNGFRRIKRISARRGQWIVENAKLIEQSNQSLWDWARLPTSRLVAPVIPFEC